jgi:hypothetical protein
MNFYEENNKLNNIIKKFNNEIQVFESKTKINYFIQQLQKINLNNKTNFNYTNNTFNNFNDEEQNQQNQQNQQNMFENKIGITPFEI